MEPFAKDGARVRTKRTWLLVATLVVTVVGVTPAVALVINGLLFHRPALALIGVIAYYGALLGGMHAWNRLWRERRGRVRADERGLWLDDDLIVARAALRHGYILRRDGASYVRLGRMLRPVDVAVDDEDDGNALLRAMRLDPARSVGQYPMTHGTYRGSFIRAAIVLALYLVVLGVLPFVSNQPAVFLAAFMAATILGVAHMVNQFVRVSVGADGIRLRHLLERACFVPFGALESAETDGRDVTLRLRDGTRLAMHHPGGKGSRRLPHLYSDRADDGRMLVDRINAQLESHRRATGEVRVVARAGRPTREWLRDVALASDEHASFRQPAVPPDELWRIVEDPAAAATARAGAALALRSRLDEEGRARLGLLADACAAPRLRVALQAVASTSETAALEDDFDALEDPGEPTKARR